MKSIYMDRACVTGCFSVQHWQCTQAGGEAGSAEDDSDRDFLQFETLSRVADTVETDEDEDEPTMRSIDEIGLGI